MKPGFSGRIGLTIHPGAIVLRPSRPVAESLDGMRSVLRAFTAFENKLILFDRATQAWTYWPAEQ